MAKHNIILRSRIQYINNNYKYTSLSLCNNELEQQDAHDSCDMCISKPMQVFFIPGQCSSACLVTDGCTGSSYDSHSGKCGFITLENYSLVPAATATIYVANGQCVCTTHSYLQHGNHLRRKRLVCLYYTLVPAATATIYVANGQCVITTHSYLLLSNYQRRIGSVCVCCYGLIPLTDANKSL